MSLLTITEKIIRKLKDNDTYKFRKPISDRQLISVISQRTIQVIRGFFMRWILHSANGILFCGKHVTIRNGYMITCNKNVIIEDFVFLDGLSQDGIVIGSNVTISRYASIICTGIIADLGKGITIGDHSAIGSYSFLGGQGGISIGNNVIMGAGVKLFSENHNYDRLDIPIRLQGESRKGITIEDDCWIGAGSIILDGTIIRKGCVVAAGSVVRDEIKNYSVIGGVPSRLLKNRCGEQ
jgi:acetyltransferase-like isoleucine patch superfamily enzyme